jgi:hypothetical protein
LRKTLIGPQVAAVVRICNRHRIPVLARGAGSGLEGGAIPCVAKKKTKKKTKNQKHTKQNKTKQNKTKTNKKNN